MLDPNPLVQAREESLATLVHTVPAFEVGLTAAVPRAEVALLVEGLLRRARTSVHAGAAG